MNLVKLSLICAACVPLVTVAQEELSTQKQKLSYAVGVNMAQRLKQTIEVDVDALTAALRDVLVGEGSRLSAEEIQSTLDEERRRIELMQADIAQKTKQAGEAFLTENAAKEGVMKTESGLQYKVIEAGEGASPGPEDTVVVHYRGTLVNGDEFDSSYKRNTPATFPVNGVIPGWQEGLQLMKVGSKYNFYIPSELAYGPNGAGGAIGPNETLIFEVELQEIK
ncbi:FKBP-type peptidyl-prolyl cis-trans isomerase [Pseudomonadota bacterium]